MSKTEELEKRVEHLETEVGLLKELVKLQNKSIEDWRIPNRPAMPMQPYYREPTLGPQYKMDEDFIANFEDEHGWAPDCAYDIIGEENIGGASMKFSELRKIMKEGKE